MSDNTGQVLCLLMILTFIILVSGSPDLLDGLIYMTGVTDGQS